VIYFVCTKCKVGLRVSPGDPLEAELLEDDTLDCWRCNGPVEKVVSVDPAAVSQMDIVDVTPQEAYCALMGVGLPKERECSAEAVRKLLVEHKVVKVDARQIKNSHRCVVNYLELDDGTKVYFSASANGATVYRIAPKHSYVEANDG